MAHQIKISVEERSTTGGRRNKTVVAGLHHYLNTQALEAFTRTFKAIHNCNGCIDPKTGDVMFQQDRREDLRDYLVGVLDIDEGLIVM